MGENFGVYKYNREILRKSTNNYRKMHHLPMRRKPLRPICNLIVCGMMGKGMSFIEKLAEIHNKAT